MLRTATILFTIYTSIFFLPTIGSARSGGPDDNLAGNPPNRQNCTGCHNSFQLNSGQGSLQLQNLPESYQPGETYRLTLALADPNARRWGFELTSLDNRNNRAGNIAVVNQQNTQVSGANNRPQFFKHTSRGTAAGQANGASWEFDWTAPAQDIGTVSFYFTGNAANNTGGTDGDRIYAASANLEAEDPPPPPPLPDSLVVSLVPGWNFISSSVVPHALDLDSVFVGLLRGGRFEMLRAMDGAIFNPGEQIDQIGNWDTLTAYQLKVRDGDLLRFFGKFATPETPLTLQNGLNWIGYTRMDTINPALVLTALGANALFVTDGMGHFAAPEAGISNLGWITPGSGLMVEMQLIEPQEFVWPVPNEGPELPPAPAPTSHFQPVMHTGSYMNVTLSEWNVRGQLSAGDEISVRSGSDVIAGAAVVHEGMTFLTIWGDDNTTEAVDGSVTDSSLIFTYWFAENDSESVLIASRADGLPVTYTGSTWGAIALASRNPNRTASKVLPQLNLCNSA